MTCVSRRTFLAMVAGAASLTFAGCGNSGGNGGSTPAASELEPKPEPLDLTGTWIAKGESEDSWQEIVIEGDAMTVNWVSDNGDTKALYWAGTYTAPVEATDTWEWASQNDIEQTQNALMASGDETKVFSYADGQISYDVTALGVTKTLHAEKK